MSDENPDLLPDPDPPGAAAKVPAKKATTRRPRPAKADQEAELEAVQYGPSYVVVWPKLSVYIPADEDGNRPEEVELGDGSTVPVVDEHIILSKGATVAASSAKELEHLRSLASLGALSAAATS